MAIDKVRPSWVLKRLKPVDRRRACSETANRFAGCAVMGVHGNLIALTVGHAR